MTAQDSWILCVTHSVSWVDLMWSHLGSSCVLFFTFFFPNWESSSLESCTVVHEIRESVLSKFDASNVSIKDSVTRYGIVFPSSMCLHSALSHSYLKEGMLSAPKERVWRALQLRQWIQYWGFSLACDKKKLPVVLLVEVKISEGAESVWSKGISQSLTTWNWQEIAHSGGIVLPNCPLKGFYPCFGST